jgi:hypothetical protein
MFKLVRSKFMNVHDGLSTAFCAAVAVMLMPVLSTVVHTDIMWCLLTGNPLTR